MTVKTLIALGALSSLALASAAQAQAPAAAAPAAPAVAGPAIPGVCTLNQQKVILTSAVGQSYLARRNQLLQVVKAELQPEAVWIQGEESALSAMPREQQQAQTARIKAYVERKQAFERKAEIRNQEMQATEQKQVQRIVAEMNPIEVQVYGEKNCGLMLDPAGIILSSPTMDVTDLVIQRLNAKITTIAFDRENLSQQMQAAPPAATPAAAPAPAKAATTTHKKK